MGGFKYDIYSRGRIRRYFRSRQLGQNDTFSDAVSLAKNVMHMWEEPFWFTDFPQADSE